MTTQQWGDIAVNATVPAATLLPLLYALATPWRGRPLAGWALLISKVGLATICWGSVLYHWLGPNYPYRAQIVLVGFSLIGLGCWLYLIAFIRVQILERRHSKGGNR